MESNLLYGISTENERKETEFFKCVKKAADITHTIVLAQAKSKKAVDAIEIRGKENKWHVLQEYMREYAPFIRSTTFLTGIFVQPVDIELYNSLTLDNINRALKTVIGFVYFKEAVNSASQKTYKACLKKLLKKTGLFGNRELDLL